MNREKLCRKGWRKIVITDNKKTAAQVNEQPYYPSLNNEKNAICNYEKTILSVDSTRDGNIRINLCESNSENNNTPISKNSKVTSFAVESCLHRGEENAISLQKLMELTGIYNERYLHSIIAQERKSGALIISSRRKGGYYLPAENDKGREEISCYIGSVCSQATSMLKSIVPFQNYLDRLEGQIEIDEK